MRRDTGPHTRRPRKNFRQLDCVYSRELLRPTKGQNMLMPMLAEIGGNIHIGLAALGAAIGVGFIGMKASEAVGCNPGAATLILVQAILSTAFAEGIVFFAIYLAGK